MHKSIKIVPIYFLNVGFIRPENFSTISSVKLFTPAGSIVFPVKYKIISLVYLSSRFNEKHIVCNTRLGRAQSMKLFRPAELDNLGAGAFHYDPLQAIAPDIYNDKQPFLGEILM